MYMIISTSHTSVWYQILASIQIKVICNQILCSWNVNSVVHEAIIIIFKQMTSGLTNMYIIKEEIFKSIANKKVQCSRQASILVTSVEVVLSYVFNALLLHLLSHKANYYQSE